LKRTDLLLLSGKGEKGCQLKKPEWERENKESICVVGCLWEDHSQEKSLAGGRQPRQLQMEKEEGFISTEEEKVDKRGKSRGRKGKKSKGSTKGTGVSRWPLPGKTFLHGKGVKKKKKKGTYLRREKWFAELIPLQDSKT